MHSFTIRTYLPFARLHIAFTPLRATLAAFNTRISGLFWYDMVIMPLGFAAS